MAKSLVGKADSTIVSTAYRSALANVPKDNLETLKIQQGAYKSLLDTVEGVFTAAKEQHEADNLELKGYLQGLEDEIASGTHKSVIQDKTVDDLDIFRQEYKAIPKGKKGEKQRLEWRSKVGRYANGLKNESEDLTTISDYYLNNAVNIQASGETGNIEFMKAIAKYRKGDKDHGLVRNTDTDGNITFTLNGITKTLPEIVEGVVPKDTNVESAELNIQEKLTKQGLAGVSDIDKNFIYDSISPTLTTKNAYLDFVYKSRGKDGRSIAQEIQSLDGQYTDVIFKVLNDKGILQQLDKGNDGLDKSDFDAKSYKAVADHILKGNNFDMSKSIALDIYSETVGKQALDRGLNAYNIKQKNLNTNNKVGSNVLGEYQTFVSQDAILDDALAGKTIYDWRGNKYTTNDGGKTYKADDDVVESTLSLLSGRQFGLQERIKTRGLNFSNNLPKIEEETQTDPSPAAQTFKDDPNYDTIYNLVGSSKFNSVTAGGTQEILSGFESLYPDFTFTRPRKDKMEIRKNGELVGLVDMDRFGAGNKNKSVQKVLELINSFNK